MVMSIYTLTDAIVIGQGVGANALAALASVLGMVIQVIVGVAHFFSSKNQLKFIKPKRVFSSIGQIIRNVILSCVGILGFLIVFGGCIGINNRRSN